MKIILILSVLFSFGCVTGNYNPEAGQCVKGGLPIVSDFFADSSHTDCLNRQASLQNQKEYEERLKNDPVYAQEESQRLKRIEDKKQSEAKAIRDQEELYQNKVRVAAAGVSLEEFTKYHGEPNTKEIRDGKQIYWYNYNVPIFVIFTKNKISDIIIDRDTIQQRENRKAQSAQNRAAERRHQENLNEAQAAREQAYWNNLTNSINNSRPVNTNCTRDVYGNVNCTSY